MEIKAVPQGSVLGPVLYLLYTCDIPKLENNTIASFADDLCHFSSRKQYHYVNWETSISYQPNQRLDKQMANKT